MLNTRTTRYSGVLFDLDGTLLDTADDLGQALNFVLAKYDFPQVAREVFRPVASDGAKGLLELGFQEQLAEFDYEQLREEFLTYYQANIAKHTVLYPGISELLLELEQKNIAWGIVTNKPEGLTRELLPHFAPLAKCNVVIGGDTLATRKPDPAPLLFACEQLQVNPQHCLYVGDALRDIEAGNRAQMTTMVAAWGYIKSGDNIHQWQADHIAENVKNCAMYI